MQTSINQEDITKAMHLNPWTSEQLFAAREYLGLSQKNVADAIGVSKMTISSLERGVAVNGSTAILYGIMLERYYAWTQFLDPEFVALKVGRRTGGSPEWAYREILREVEEDVQQRIQRSAV